MGGRWEEVRLDLTEEEVTSRISEWLPGVDLSIDVKNLQINFEEGQALVLATVDVGVDVKVAGCESAVEVERAAVLIERARAADRQRCATGDGQDVVVGVHAPKFIERGILAN